MNEIYLNRNDIKSILDFLDSFSDKDIVLITSNTSSGIGAIIQASIMDVDVNSHTVTITKNIADESTW